MMKNELNNKEINHDEAVNKVSDALKAAKNTVKQNLEQFNEKANEAQRELMNKLVADAFAGKKIDVQKMIKEIEALGSTN